MMVVLNLVDVNKDTASQTWPLLLEAIKTAHFTAIDLELSGLGSVITRGKGATIEARYDDACDTAKTRAILSLGVACFKWHGPTQHKSHETQLTKTTDDSSSYTGHDTSVSGRSEAVGVKVEVFNVWLMRQTPYTVDPSSALFLLQHGFNFNKQVAQGIPYTPGPLQIPGTGVKEEVVSLHHLFAALLTRGKPLVVHNGWIDLLFLYENLYSPLPPSLGTLTADMSEMFVGGVYDTKAIATYQVPHEATFLEYLFRKCQRDNEQAMTRGSPCLTLHQAPLPSSGVQTESVPLTPIQFPSLEESVDVKVCRTFAIAGYCHKSDCSLSHDVLIVLAQQEHALRMKEMKRKRKRKRDGKLVADDDMKRETDKANHCSRPETASNEQSDLVKQFLSEIEAAKLELGGRSSPPNKSPTSRQDQSDECSSSETENSSKSSGSRPSYGHRAGFDAFMTGYIFAYFALNTSTSPFPSSSLTFDEALITGLSSMRNKLGNRNRPVPLILAKSQYDKTSPGHRENWSKILELGIN